MAALAPFATLVALGGLVTPGEAARTATDVVESAGLHLLLIGYLAYRSGYVPRPLGVLIAIAGLGYLIDTIGVVLAQGSWTSVGAFTFIGEFLLALWLVIWGRRLTMRESGLNDEPIAVAR